MAKHIKMDKKYIITCKTNAYAASRQYIDEDKVLDYDGNTPIKWIHDDNIGYGYSLDEARQILMDMAENDYYEHGDTLEHEFTDDTYYHDVYTYRIEEA